jgi:hypothetical protein
VGINSWLAESKNAPERSEPMSHYTEDLVSPLSLKLDINNPRFIAPVNPTQEDIRLHLLQHEEVEGLIQSIVRFGGITPGERPIVCEEDGHLVVLEGNRRVCAYQLLLDPTLYPTGWAGQLTAPPDLLQTLDPIPVDVVASRTVADPILTMRHLGGIKDWPTIAQYNYMSTRYLSGKSIDDLHRDSGLKKTKSQIKDNLGDFHLLKQAIALPVWTKNELEGPLDWYEMDVTVFTRIFHTKGSMLAVGLSFDPTTFQPVWSDATVAEQVLELVARAAFIDKAINTRTKSILDVPGLATLFKAVAPAPQPTTTPKEKEQEQGETHPKPTQPQEDPQPDPSDNTPQAPEPESTLPPATTNPASAPPPIPATIGFFEALTVEKLDSKNANHIGIINVAREIRYLSKNNLLNNIPNAAAMLLRTLIELTLKHHLTNTGVKLEGLDGKKDPSLKNLINHYKQNLVTVIPDKQTQRVFRAVFKNEGLKDSLDLIVHHTGSTSATPEMLRMLAKTGLFTLIQDLLNVECQ